MSDPGDPQTWLNWRAYDRATRRLSLEQRGLLFQLTLVMLGPEGPLPLDPEGMRLSVRCDERTWRRCWPAIRQFFEPEGMPWLRVSEDMPEDEL